MSTHPIVHVEISAIDRKKSSKFYEDVFGWKVQHIDEMNYTTFMPGSGVRVDLTRSPRIIQLAQ